MIEIEMTRSIEMNAGESEQRMDLQSRFGPLLGGQDLVKSLGYKSAAAFRQAVKRGTIPVEVFEIPNRRGKFALTSDIECWLAGVKRIRIDEKGGDDGCKKKPD